MANTNDKMILIKKLIYSNEILIFSKETMCFQYLPKKTNTNATLFKIQRMS